LHAVQHSAFRLVREGSASVRSQAEDSLSPRRGQEIWSSMFVCTMLYYHPGIFGGVRQEISETYFIWPHELYQPLRVFWASKRGGRGPPDGRF
jgi:hypothetical protein